MEITEQTYKEVTVVEINGRLDTTNYGSLESKLSELIDNGQTRIIIDCSKMDYVSSSGLRVFLIALKKINLMKGRFILAALQETIREIFEIAGFTTIFQIYRTREEAERAMGE
jgi:anti-anti-sigma factor